MAASFTTLVLDAPVTPSLRTCIVAAAGRLRFLLPLIPVRRLAILLAVWNFHMFGYFEKPQHRGAGGQISDKAERQTIGGAKKGDSKIAALSMMSAYIGEGSA